MDRRFNDNDPMWLVKQNHRIEGPYSFNEVLSRIASGHLSVAVEVIAPLDRWRPVQAHPQFAAALAKLSALNSTMSGESTKTIRTELTHHTITGTQDREPSQGGTVTETGTLTQPHTQDDSETPTPIPEKDPGLSLHAEGTVVAPTVPSSTAPRTTRSKPRVSKDVTLFEKPWVPYVGYALAGVLAATLLFVLYPRGSGTTVAQRVAQSDPFVKHMDEGMSFNKKGEYGQALESFKRAHKLRKKDLDLLYRMSPLMIQMKKETLPALSLLRKALPDSYKADDMIFNHNITGLALSYDRRYKQALNHYNKALKINPNSPEVLINKGYTLFLQGKYSESRGVLKKAVVMDMLPLGQLYYMMSSLRWALNKPTKKKWQQVEKEFQQLALPYNTQQEVLLLRAYMYKQLGRTQQYRQTMSNALQVSPFQTADHIQPVTIDWRGMRWTNYDFVCLQKNAQLNVDLTEMLHFICEYHKGSQAQSLEVRVSSWMSKSANSEWPHIAQSLLLTQQGRFDRAKLSLDLAAKYNQTASLTWVLKTLVCKQLNDKRCVEGAVEKIKSSSTLYYALAKARASAAPSVWVTKGLGLSPNFRPLVLLK